LGRSVQDVIRAAKADQWHQDPDGQVVCGGIALQPREYQIDTVVDRDNGPAGSAHAVAVLPSGGFVVLDTAVTAELEAEGLARDLIRAVQQARRDAGLAVGDRIELLVNTASAEVIAAVTEHGDLIGSETLAQQIQVERSDANAPDHAEPAGPVDSVTLGNGSTVSLSIRALAKLP
jgi:isoleucyl-tRNA synthetase